MSAYDNFVQDFPSRILKLYKLHLDSASLARLDVTFLLSLTSTAIAIPFERLRDPNRCRYPHPSHDRQRFIEAAKRFDELCSKNLRECELWDPTFNEWRYGKLQTINGEPESWEELRSSNPIGSDLHAETVITHLRHSLAHGNLYTRGEEVIEEIIMLTGEAKKGFYFLVVTPGNLRQFLQKWVTWLQTLPMQASIFIEDEKRAYSHRG